jgi:hypothetical protein
MKTNTFALLAINPPTSKETAMAWVMSLSAAGDSVGHEVQAVVDLGAVVQAGAMLAMMTPPDGMPSFGMLPLQPADAETWLITSGQQADTSAGAGTQSLITTGEAIPAMVRLLQMECPPELAAKIQAKMG